MDISAFWQFRISSWWTFILSVWFLICLLHNYNIHNTFTQPPASNRVSQCSLGSLYSRRLSQKYDTHSILIRWQKSRLNESKGCIAMDKIVAKSARQSERYLLSEKSTCHHAKTGSEKWYAWADVRLLLIRHLVRSPA